MITWIDSHLIREPLGMSALEGAVVAVGEWSRRETPEPQDDITSRNLRKERTVAHRQAVRKEEP
jgi:hypothetical protein